MYHIYTVVQIMCPWLKFFRCKIFSCEEAALEVQMSLYVSVRVSITKLKLSFPLSK